MWHVDCRETICLARLAGSAPDDQVGDAALIDLVPLLDEGRGKAWLIDLRGIGSVSSQGLAHLLRGLREGIAAGSRFAAINPSTRLKNVLQTIRIEFFMPLFVSEHEAVHVLKRTGVKDLAG